MKFPKTRILERSNFLQILVRSFMSRLLDFTDLPYLRGSLNLLLKERDLALNTEMFTNLLEDEITDLLLLLKPSQLKGHSMVRVGSEFDGGYVIPVEFAEGHTWLTFGLGQNFQFENSLARQDCRVVSFDHTLVGRPKNLLPSIDWKPFGLGGSSTGEILNVSDALVLADCVNEPWCLKSDIEGSEWSYLPDLLKIVNLPDVIAVELHGFLDLIPSENFIKKVEILRQIREKYDVIFLAVNNFAPVLSFRGYILPHVVEVTFIKSGIRPAFNIDTMSETRFLSSPNDPNKMPIRLRFPGTE